MPKKGPAAGEYVNLLDAAVLLGITRQHMRRVAIDLELETFEDVKDRRYRLFRRSDIEALRHPRLVARGLNPKKTRAGSTRTGKES